MVNSADFGKRLQEILTYYAISATDFSNQISVNRSTISHLLSGRNKPSLEFVLKVLEKFPEVELYWLLNGKGTFPFQKGDHSPVLSSSGIPTENKTIQKTTSVVPNIHNSFSDPAIDQVIIFYKNGNFKVYKN